ncbi:hypothetical protein AYI70_g5450 [Smittium culicis]|uniref:DUF7137 domain-containing protein n=1 Tax=Smittium culicis TaxID=133412 RepID=A0A1R1XUE4_9FUNG|nr:hypothetical protein AYI70_g5450 [Smittium culicis]
MILLTPPVMQVQPMFELGSVVKLSWKYDQSTTSPPQKMMIIGTMPNNPRFLDSSTNKPYVWNVAINVTGTQYDWDTKAFSPSGISLSAASDYQLTFYDGDIGLVNGTLPPQGKMLNNYLSFSFYNSGYNSTNNGIPSNYDPSAASSIIPSLYTFSSFILFVLLSSTSLYLL